MSRGKATALVLLEVSAVSDMIDRSTLLSCLQTFFGVWGSILKLFTSYLTECYQSIKIGSTLADISKLLFVVPQGSVLGPLLFSLYTNPISLQVYVHSSQKNSSTAFELLNMCLDDVKEIYVN